MMESEIDLVDDADPVLQTRLALAQLAGEDRDHWTTGALSERVLELLDVQERLSAEVLRLVGRWVRARAWEADGALSAAAWLEHRCPLGASEARRMVKTGRIVDQHSEFGDGLAGGDVSVAHIEAVAKVASKDRAPLLADHAAVMADQATALSVRDFTMVMRRWASLADDVLASDTFEQQWERRHLHASVTLNGWVTGQFLLDPAAGQTLIQTLDHLAPPDWVDTLEGPRSLSQRRADAIAELADRYVNGNRPGANPPSVNVVVDVAALNGDTIEAALARCDLDGIGPVTRQTLDQIACDATVTRVVTAGATRILDMGRSTRLATPVQRRALTIRDRQCRFPGCHRMPQWCDAHHITSWRNGGATDLANLILLCRRHHTLIHNTKWTITHTPNGDTQFTHPTRGP